MLRPSHVAVQACLLLAVVLQNDWQPEASFAVISMTRALAQAALSQRSALQGEGTANHLASEKLSVIWQETLLALCFGRPITALVYAGAKSVSRSMDNLSYNQCMLAILQAVASSYEPSYSALDEAITVVREVESRAVRRLQEKDHCRSIQDRIEYYAFRIRTRFVTTALLAARGDGDAPTSRQGGSSIASQCRSCCIQTIRAFLDMHNFTIIPLRTWSFLYSALASALLLRYVGGQDDQEARELQQSLYEVLTRLEEDGGPVAEGALLFRNRYVRALQELHRTVSSGERLGRTDAREGNVEAELYDSHSWLVEARLTLFRTDEPIHKDVPDLSSIWQIHFAGAHHHGSRKILY